MPAGGPPGLTHWYLHNSIMGVCHCPAFARFPAPATLPATRGGTLEPWPYTAAGLRSLPETDDAFASVQAAWRFFQNPAVTLPDLAGPLLDRARRATTESCDHFVLLVHDWSQLHYSDHATKQQRVALSQSTDLGYELQATLALSDRSGAPLAPVYHGLLAADGVHSTLSSEPESPLSQLDRLAPVMTTIASWGWSKPSVHILDREADSIAHLRYWHGRGHAFLVRANDRGLAQYKGRQRSLCSIADGLRRGKTFRQAREV